MVELPGTPALGHADNEVNHHSLLFKENDITETTKLLKQLRLIDPEKEITENEMNKLKTL